jgi:hypothetical protein
MASPRDRSAWLITGACAALLVALLSLHVRDPWSFPNDDNGAWFSAVARSHREAGLTATRGQDFFMDRQTGELIPYLHHPPLPGLLLAAAFTLAGSDSPGTARLTFALLHLATFLLIAALVGKVWGPVGQRRFVAMALVTAAVVPMSAFYGKMPNHEVPGLLFFLSGVLAWGVGDQPPSARQVALACAAWALAVFSSWHAVFCALGWLLVHGDAGRRKPAFAAAAGVFAAAGAVLVHLAWAGGWELHASQSKSAGYWFAGSDGAALGERLGFLRHAVGIGIERYAFLPALLSMGWLAFLAADCIRGRRWPGARERRVIGLGLGTAIYATLFPRAVSFHAYQGFYLIPFVAVASSIALSRLEGLSWTRRRAWFGRSLAAAVVLGTFMLGLFTTLRMYRKPSPRVVQIVRSLESQYR